MSTMHVSVAIKKESQQDNVVVIDKSPQNQKVIIKNEDEESDQFTRPVEIEQAVDGQKAISEDFQYEEICVKSYSSSFDKEEAIQDFSDLFNKNFLEYEKLNFHQRIINIILKNKDHNEFQDIQEQYIAHLRNIVSLETFNCLLCNYQSIHKENLRNHLLFIHEQALEVQLFKCIFQSCDFKAQSLSDLKNHQSRHDQSFDVDSHGDVELSGLLKIKQDIGNHIPTQTNKSKKRNRGEKAKYFCKICDLGIIGRESYVKHNATHKDPDNPKRFLCYICNHASSKVNIKKHLFKVHNIETTGVRHMKVHKCELCDYRTDLRSSLRSHMLIHKNPDEVEWLKCTYCDFMTKHKVSLRGHLKNHMPDREARKKFMCEVCSKSFERKHNLEGHMLTHKSIEEVDEIYRCPECSYQTKFKCHLITHKQCHQEAKHVCDTCGFRTKRKGSYNIHLLIHKDKSELQLFKCTLCPYETKFKHDLKKHLASTIHSILARRASTKPRRKKTRNKGGITDANLEQVKKEVLTSCTLP